MNSKTKFSVNDVVRRKNTSDGSTYRIRDYEGDGYYTVEEIDSGLLRSYHSRSLELHGHKRKKSERATKVMSTPAPQFRHKWPKIAGVRPPGQEHLQNQSILKACAQTRANIPAAVREYFKCPERITTSEFDFYSKNGLEVEIPMTPFVTDKAEGYTIDLSRVPAGINTLRIVMPYEETPAPTPAPAAATPVVSTTPSTPPPVGAVTPVATPSPVTTPTA